MKADSSLEQLLALFPDARGREAWRSTVHSIAEVVDRLSPGAWRIYATRKRTLIRLTAGNTEVLWVYRGRVAMNLIGRLDGRGLPDDASIYPTSYSAVPITTRLELPLARMPDLSEIHHRALRAFAATCCVTPVNRNPYVLVRRTFHDQALADYVQYGGTADEEVIDEQAERILRRRTDLRGEDVERLARARKGQGAFREAVLAVGGTCRVTGVSDRAFLVASHIKPWRESNDREKVDGHNGLMLSPHIDFLFDRHLISFDGDGGMVLSKRLPAEIADAWALPPSVAPTPLKPRQKRYLAAHRRKMREKDRKSEE